MKKTASDWTAHPSIFVYRYTPLPFSRQRRRYRGLASFKPTYPHTPSSNLSSPFLAFYSSSFDVFFEYQNDTTRKAFPCFHFFVFQLTATHKASLSFSPHLSFSHELAKINTLIHLCPGLWKYHPYQWRKIRSTCGQAKRLVLE